MHFLPIHYALSFSVSNGFSRSCSAACSGGRVADSTNFDGIKAHSMRGVGSRVHGSYRGDAGQRALTDTAALDLDCISTTNNLR